MIEVFLIHWAVVALCILLVISGVEQINAMTPKTNNLVRWSSVVKTTGAAMLALAHLMMMLVPGRNISNVVPVLLLLLGQLLCKIVDRRRRQTCDAIDCRNTHPEKMP